MQPAKWVTLKPEMSPRETPPNSAVPGAMGGGGRRNDKPEMTESMKKEISE